MAEDKKVEVSVDTDNTGAVVEEAKVNELEAYKKVVDGLASVGEGLVAIGESKGKQPIKLLISQLVNKLGFNDPDVGDLIGMIRFAVENDDLSLEKLTAEIAGV